MTLQMAPPESLGDWLRLAALDPKVQMYEWAVNQMGQAVEK